jgi:antitoxin HigA-1
MARVPAHRAPIHPGRMLLKEFLKPMKLSQRALAESIDVPYQHVNEIVNGRRGISPGMAVRLGHFFDMSTGFWLNLQTRWDLYQAERAEAEVLRRIPKYPMGRRARLRT